MVTCVQFLEEIVVNVPDAGGDGVEESVIFNKVPSHKRIMSNNAIIEPTTMITQLEDETK